VGEEPNNKNAILSAHIKYIEILKVIYEKGFPNIGIFVKYEEAFSQI
jgi:hypothetical protein